MSIDRLRTKGIKITSLNEKIHLVHGRSRSRSPFSNSVIITDKKNALIDTGCGLDILREICSCMPIDLVINSHSHPDHTSGNWLLRKMCNPHIAVPAGRQDTIGRSRDLAVRMVGEDLADFWIDTTLSITGFRDFNADSCYGEGHVFEIGSTRLIAMHTPGHLADHYCLWEPVEKILFGFDIDLSPFGGWYGNEESDISAFRNSIERISALPAVTYISSHARPVRNGYIQKRLDSYQSIFDLRNELIVDIVKKNPYSSLTDIVMFSPVYNADYRLSPEKILCYGETQMIKKHLELLVENEKLAFDGKTYSPRN